MLKLILVMSHTFGFISGQLIACVGVAVATAVGVMAGGVGGSVGTSVGANVGGVGLPVGDAFLEAECQFP